MSARDSGVFAVLFALAACGAPVLAGCGGAAPSGGQLAVTGGGAAAGGEADAGTPTAEQTASDVSALATDVIAPQLCPHLIGSFVGLPGNEEAAGRDAGRLASEGRWWIRTCDAHVEDGKLSLTIGGPGWTWVSQESSGFRIQQYLLFEADAHLVTALEIAYDRETRVASLWMRPEAPATAHITPRGTVSAAPTNAVASIFAAVAQGTIDDRARAQVEQIGSDRLSTRLGAGFTMTVALDRQQVDFMVGALPRGVTPARPWDDVAGAPWVVNQRARVQPGGLDVIGPLAPPADGAPALAVDLVLEEGPGVVVRTACDADVHASIDARLHDAGAGGAAGAPAHAQDLFRLAAVGPTQHVVIPRGTCAQTLLLVSMPDGATLPSAYRVRVLPDVPSPVANAGGQGGTTAPARPARIRVQLVNATIAGRDPSGGAWDVEAFGPGNPDPFTVVFSVPMSRELMRTPPQDDTLGPQWSVFLPGALDPLADLPVRFTVLDRDSMSHDDVVGTAVLSPSDVPATATNLELPLLGEGATAPRTGTLRLRIEPVPR